MTKNQGRRGARMVASYKQKLSNVPSKPSPQVERGDRTSSTSFVKSVLHLYDSESGEFKPRNGWGKCEVLMGKKIHTEMKMSSDDNGWRELCRQSESTSFEDTLSQDKYSHGIDYGNRRGVCFENQYQKRIQQQDLRATPCRQNKTRKKVWKLNGSHLDDLPTSPTFNPDYANAFKNGFLKADISGLKNRRKSHQVQMSTDPGEMKKLNLMMIGRLVEDELAKPSFRSMLFDSGRAVSSEEMSTIKSVQNLALSILEANYGEELARKILPAATVHPKVVETCVFAVRLRGGSSSGIQTVDDVQLIETCAKGSSGHRETLNVPTLRRNCSSFINNQ
mmetsp:Transcript_2379/g.3268  ORF Transcript_2379/g.3268 Transcript_2379/m.3268 type:complete len:335 (-) Transcript_2379:307-1311(-)